jgi:hypothetical protein
MPTKPRARRTTRRRSKKSPMPLRPSIKTDEDCRAILRQTINRLDALDLGGLWAWLEQRSPQLHAELTTALPAALDAAWAGPRFWKSIDDFWAAIDLAIAVWELERRRGASRLFGVPPRTVNHVSSPRQASTNG